MASFLVSPLFLGRVGVFLGQIEGTESSNGSFACGTGNGGFNTVVARVGVELSIERTGSHDNKRVSSVLVMALEISIDDNGWSSSS